MYTSPPPPIYDVWGVPQKESVGECFPKDESPRAAPVSDYSLCIECSLDKVLYYISVFFPKLCKVLWKFGFTLSPIATEVKDFFNGVARDALENRKNDKDQVGIKNKYYIHCTSTYIQMELTVQIQTPIFPLYYLL